VSAVPVAATVGTAPAYDTHTPFPAWMRAVAARMETVLDSVLPPADTVPMRLHEAMRYAVLGGGKRVRPLLALAAGELTGASATRAELAGAAVELIHAYSLVHDDLPCMDDDVLRRGKPTVHVQFDEATAMLAGDALQPLAFEVLARETLADSADARQTMVRILARAAGSLGMGGGQAIDLGAVGQSLTEAELERMHLMKTGAIIEAAVLMGALCGPAHTPAHASALQAYARAVGLLFQVVDDILDATADTATLGKTANKDADNDKPTYVSLLGLDGANARAAALLGEAHTALASFGAEATRLRQLAHFIVERTH
jgi:farnesyl diphosphate synthase